MPEPSPVNEPTLPHGRRVELPGRGTTFVREVAGPPGAPTVILLHGLVASAGLNWFQVFEPLSRRFHVIAPDLRGHGRGVRSGRRFTLADCADDVAALLDKLGCGPVIVVGYSMGGPVAQLLWKRHPERVAGLVLCATGTRFVPGVRERLIFVTAVAAAASGTRAGQAMTRVPWDFVRHRVPAVIRRRPQSFRVWAAGEMRRHDWRMILEAAHAVGTYNSEKWIGQVDVPTAVIVTTEDNAIPPLEQMRLLLAIPHSTMHRIDDGHTVCAKRSFATPLVTACTAVADGAGGRRRPPAPPRADAMAD